MGITIGGQHLEHTTTELQDRDIKCTTTKVEHSNLHVLVSLVNTVCQRSGSRLVHDTLNVQAGNLTSLLGSLTLRVREVSRHGNHSICHFLSQIVLSRLLHLLQHHSRDFLSGVQTTVNVNTWHIVVATHYLIRHTRNFLLHLIPVLTHETLDGEHSLCWIGDGLTLCRITHLALATFYECYDRRSSALTFAIRDYYRFVALEYSNA